MFERITRRLCSVYEIPPGDLYLLTHPDEIDDYPTFENENTIRGEVLK